MNDESRSRFRPIEGLSIDELLSEKISIDNELRRVKEQLQAARVRAATMGEYSDPDWYQRAQRAQRILGTRSQQIQAQVSKLRREEKARNKQQSRAERELFHHTFMGLVRDRLGDQEFEALCDVAQCEVAAFLQRVEAGGPQDDAPLIHLLPKPDS